MEFAALFDYMPFYLVYEKKEKRESHALPYPERPFSSSYPVSQRYLSPHRYGNPGPFRPELENVPAHLF